LVERFMGTLVLLTVFLTLTLVGVKIGLADQLKVIESGQPLSNEYATANADTRDINNMGRRLDQLQGASVAFSPGIHDLLARVPEGVQISGMSFDARGHAFSVSGLADTRDNLLKFEESLRGSPYLTNVENPLNNLFQKTDANFTMTAALHLSGTSTAPTPKP
jgi:Tfp pilus assembly protein PilN